MVTVKGHWRTAGGKRTWIEPFDRAATAKFARDDRRIGADAQAAAEDHGMDVVQGVDGERPDHELALRMAHDVQFIAGLSDRERTVVEGRFLEGMSLEKVAKRVGMSVSSVHAGERQLADRYRQALRERRPLHEQMVEEEGFLDSLNERERYVAERHPVRHAPIVLDGTAARLNMDESRIFHTREALLDRFQRRLDDRVPFERRLRDDEAFVGSLSDCEQYVVRSGRPDGGCEQFGLSREQFYQVESDVERRFYRRLDEQVPVGERISETPEFLDSLDERERYIIERRSRHETSELLGTIGETLGLTRERVRQIQHRVTERFVEQYGPRPSRSEQLRNDPKFWDSLQDGRERDIVERRLRPEKWASLEELGDEYGMSREEVRQVEKEAMRRYELGW